MVPKFNYAESSIPSLPSKICEGKFIWKWDKVYDSAIDIIYELPHSCFIGAVSFALDGNSAIRSAEIFVEGVLSGFYRAETGSGFGGKRTVPVGAQGKVVVLRISGNVENIVLDEPEILGAYDDGIADVWPFAKRIMSGEETVALSGVAPACDEDEIFASEFLVSALREEMDEPFSALGVEVKIQKSAPGELENEEFRISVNENGVNIRGGSRIALLYAVDTLLQLRRGKEFLKATIEDKPDKEFRGVHIGLPRLENFEFARRLFRYVLIPLRYNTVIIEFAGGMRFDRRPEISEAWLRADRLAKEKKQPKIPHSSFGAAGTVLEKDDVRRLVGFAKELGIEVIPEVQSFGHVQYLTYAYPEIAEIDPDAEQVNDTRAEDAKPDQFYHHCYCPSLDKSYEIIFDVIDEIIEVVRPKRFVHIGHDEIYQIGLCPRCKGTPADVLYEKHVRTLYEYIKSKGLKTILWADMMTRDDKYDTFNARDRLPRDIVALEFIWYFYLDKDTELALLDRNYNVAVGNLYSSHFPRYTERMGREGMIGAQISMWSETSETAIANLGKFYDMAYLSEMLWNADKYDERLRTVYGRIIGSKILPDIRARIRGTYSPIQPNEYSIPLPKDSKGLPEDVKTHCAGAIIADNVSVRIDATADSLIFTHATVRAMPRTSWQEILPVGEYRINYEDGSTAVAPLGYGTNVLTYNSTYGAPLPQRYYRHYGYIGTYFADPVFCGKCADGKDLTFLAMPWDNPYPEKRILSVTYVPDDNAPTQLILTDIKAVGNK